MSNPTLSDAPKQAPVCKPSRGFGALCCPKCNELGKVSIDLDDLDGDEACQCRECDETFSLQLVRDMIATWTKCIAWIDSAPLIEE